MSNLSGFSDDEEYPRTKTNKLGGDLLIQYKRIA